MTEKPTKPKFLDRVAEENGVAIVVLDAEGGERSASNNNSVCQNLWNSPEFRPKCDLFCGRAFDSAHAAGGSIEYTCHAGLACEAVPVSDRGKPFVAIVGRTFLKAEHYRNATDRAINGDWKRFRPTEFFENVLMSGSFDGIKRAVAALARFIVHADRPVLELPAEQTGSSITEQIRKNPVHHPAAAQPAESGIGQSPASQESAANIRNASAVAEAAGLRSLFSALMKLEYGPACKAILEHLAERYGFRSLVWLDRHGDLLQPAIAIGALSGKTIRVGIPVTSEGLTAALSKERPLILRERRPQPTADPGRGLALFPVTVGTDIRSAFAAEPLASDPANSELIRFAKAVGPQIEILRLRDEVSRRDWVSQGVRRFSDSLNRIDTEDFWMHVTQVSAELLKAERASLLIRGDRSDQLQAKASIGTSADLEKATDIGSRIARHALAQGDPVIVRDIATAGMPVAPLDWHYKTSSFISFPIMIGERRLAVMNFTDRAGGGAFGERDLELLRTIAPQIAVAIDRTSLKDRAGQFEQLSVTDPLTGLLNRRYLDERLLEEMTRSRRHHSPITMMMIDVDSFKSYNDSFGHPAGDVALTAVAAAMKDTLRGDDVAARFGGEEFAILLPGTQSEEAAAIAERIRLRVEHTRFPHRQITVSIGIAGLTSEFETFRDWISAADMALYRAKEHGRNNVQDYGAMGRSFKERLN